MSSLHDHTEDPYGLMSCGFLRMARYYHSVLRWNVSPSTSFMRESLLGHIWVMTCSSLYFLPPGGKCMHPSFFTYKLDVFRKASSPLSWKLNYSVTHVMCLYMHIPTQSTLKKGFKNTIEKYH